MLPHDLHPETVPLPPGDRNSAVFFSGNSVRHLRLGYLIQRRFPGLLKAWWTYTPGQSQRVKEKVTKAWRLLTNSQTGNEVLEMWREGDMRSLLGVARRRIRKGDLRRLGRMVKAYAARNDYAGVEREMFGAELEALRATAVLHPEHIDAPNSAERAAELARIDPYLIVTFGGPLLGRRILSKARGFAINQHAGWSPSLKGAATTETAIYHRELGWVGNTVHLMDTHADSGAIVRRSTAALHPDDELAHCFLAVCAVGSKMMLEAIATVLHSDELAVFPQPRGGQTVLNIDYSPAKREAIARDLKHGWLGDALKGVQEF